MKFKIPIPKTYLIIIIILTLISAFICSVIFELVEIGNVFEWIKWFIFSAFFVIVLALIGAIFVGMYISHRILTVRGFTPFEKAMLEMKEDINKIKQKLENIEKKL